MTHIILEIKKIDDIIESWVAKHFHNGCYGEVVEAKAELKTAINENAMAVIPLETGTTAVESPIVLTPVVEPEDEPIVAIEAPVVIESVTEVAPVDTIAVAV